MALVRLRSDHQALRSSVLGQLEKVVKHKENILGDDLERPSGRDGRSLKVFVKVKGAFGLFFLLPNRGVFRYLVVFEPCKVVLVWKGSPSDNV